VQSGTLAEQQSAACCVLQRSCLLAPTWQSVTLTPSLWVSHECTSLLQPCSQVTLFLFAVAEPKMMLTSGLVDYYEVLGVGDLQATELLQPASLSESAAAE
jgi:hypothetical protein